MYLDYYQRKARETAVYPREHSLVYPTLGLAGEAGELANKVKKILRGDAHTQLARPELIAELGDVLWYVANVASDLDCSLSEIASRNLEKLALRKERGSLKGSGDQR